MKFLLNHLQVRPKEEKINFSSLEEKYDFVLPPLYKIFLNTYILEKPQYDIDYYPDIEVGFDDLHWDLELSMLGAKHVDEDFEERGMLHIANSGIHSGGICICTKGEDADKIYIDSDYDPRFMLLAGNVFEFFRGLTLDIIEEI